MMKNRILFKTISFVVAIFILITGFSFNTDLSIIAEASESQTGNTYYKLFTGAYHIWCNSAGNWQSMGKPGDKKTLRSNFNIVPGAENVEIFAYDPAATDDKYFDFNNSTNYKWYSTTMATDKDSYDTNYYNPAAIINRVDNDSKDYNQLTGELSVIYNITLSSNDGDPIDIKDMLGDPGGKQEFVDYIGYVDSTLEQLMDLLDPWSNNYNPNVQGLMYFIPIVVKYEIPSENNLEMLSVEFIDASGNVTTEPIASRRYTARYNIKYTGEDMTSPVKVTVTEGHIRNRKDGDIYYWASPWANHKTVQLKNGDTFHIDVGSFLISEASIYANGTIKYDSTWNTDTTDDYGEKEIIGLMDNLALAIESIDPSVTKIYSPGNQVTQDYEITYTINYVAPENASLVTDVVLTLLSNSNTSPRTLEKTVNVLLYPGLNRFSITTGNLDVKNKTNSFNMTLEVNKSRENPINESTFADNKDSVTELIETIYNVPDPCVGEINRENPSWDVTYNISTATGYWKEVGYHGTHSRCVERSDPDENGRTHCIDRERYDCTCSRCVGGSVDHWSQTSAREENLEITNIMFTSKDIGTVNLLKKDGKIKAGYGFDLEITAKYTGSESPKRPSTWGGCNYQRVNPGAYVLNSLPNNIYVILPDGQIISNKTKTGIKNLMDCQVTKSGNLSRTLKCQVKLGNTFGNKETRKLYISEETRDGTYDITVCTAKFNGVSPRATLPLFDKRKVQFVVKGKFTDDVTTHIVQ